MKNAIVVFKNSLQVEGKLISFQDNEIVLESLDSRTRTIIPDVKDTVLFYKINIISEEYEKISEKPVKTVEDLKVLTETKAQLNEMERRSIKDKMHSPTLPVKKDIYAPQHTTIKSPVQYTDSKTTRANTGIASSLQGVFGKKY